MKTSDFTALLKEPCSITNEQIKSVEDIIETHPYFQAAHVLHLKGLKKQNSYKYNAALKKTAAYTTNRTVLFDFITSDALNTEKKETQEAKQLLENEIVDLEVIVPEKIIETKTVVKEHLEIGRPLQFDKGEKHSFNEWLQLTSLNPIDRVTTHSDTQEDKKEEQEINSNNENFELIEKFLEKNPKIRPATSLESIDISYESVSENESLMTETLARVYLEQKKYKKAIQAFKILSLKYPEKSGFFADRIKAVEFLQKNNS